MKKVRPYLLLLLLSLGLVAPVACGRPLPIFAEIPDFSLTDQRGLSFGRQDLLGKVWVANFIFTNCSDICPLLTEKMSRLQKESTLAQRNDLHFVSFSVDPERDSPSVLATYADRYHADAALWSFLTGPLDLVEKAVVGGFKMGMTKMSLFQIAHGERFVLVDSRGRIRGYYESDPEGLKSLIKDIPKLLRESNYLRPPLIVSEHRPERIYSGWPSGANDPNPAIQMGVLGGERYFPLSSNEGKRRLMNSLGPTLAALNAILNGLSALFLTAGFLAIRKKKIAFHRKCMVTAFVLSVLFLISYLTRFYLTGVHRFPGDGWVKTAYLTLLTSHTLLAVVTPFLAIRTLYLAAKGRFEQHRRIARFTFPIWMYVSITGVIVYGMLYQIRYH